MYKFYAQKISGRIHTACTQLWEEESHGVPPPNRLSPGPQCGWWTARGTRPLTGNLFPPLCICFMFEKGRPRNVFIKSTVYLERSIYSNLFIWKLRKLNSIFFIIQHFIHNKYKLFTATVKKAHPHRGTPSEPGPVHCDAGLYVLEGGVLFKKEAYFYNFCFLFFK